MNVLDHMITAACVGGEILDLQVIRPNPRVELAGELICTVDGRPLFAKSDAAAAAVDAAIATGRLVETGTDDHDVLSHYPDGPDLVDDFAGKTRQLPRQAIPRLNAIAQPLVIRERCRLRRLSRLV